MSLQMAVVLGSYCSGGFTIVLGGSVSITTMFSDVTDVMNDHIISRQ